MSRSLGYALDTLIAYKLVVSAQGNAEAFRTSLTIECHQELSKDAGEQKAVAGERWRRKTYNHASERANQGQKHPPFAPPHLRIEGIHRWEVHAGCPTD
jgi:hypothetical protein